MHNDPISAGSGRPVGTDLRRTDSLARRAGPSGAGPTGAGPTGAGPTGAGPSDVLLWQPVIAVPTRAPAAVALVADRVAGTGRNPGLRALSEAQAWADRIRPLTVMVPIAALTDDLRPAAGGRTVVARVATALERSPLHPASLVVEVPVAAVMADRQGLATALRSLSALGVRTALDGSGDGCGALSCSSVAPFDFIRLARHFLARVDHGPEGDALLDAIADLSHRGRPAVVADGIETEAQLRRLSQIGVRYARGRYLGVPAATPPGVGSGPDVVSAPGGPASLPAPGRDGAPGPDGYSRPDGASRPDGVSWEVTSGEVADPAPARAGADLTWTPCRSRKRVMGAGIRAGLSPQS